MSTRQRDPGHRRARIDATRMTVVPTNRTGPPTRRAPSGRRIAERSPQLAELDLSGLRSYRTTLTEEEGRVSYWRRILQARLDVVRAGSSVSHADVRRLRPVLTAGRVSAGRTALLQVLPASDVPPLPNLARLWEHIPDPNDPEAAEEHAQALQAAEEELSAYRHTLHAKIDAASDELIARYRETPALCLSVLPSDRSPAARNQIADHGGH